ncbi:MAG: trypsin-like serine protease [Euryarchaeota archaeon]|nr:trypsin-like serine protease [Euryarchaeota archaeon]
MKCQNCGEENPEGATFCRNCGSEITKAEPKPEVTTPPRQEPEKPPEKEKSNKKLFLVVGVVVILIAAIGIYYASTQNFFAPVTPQNATVLVVSTASGSVKMNDPTAGDPRTAAVYDVQVEDIPLGGGSGFIISKDGYIVTAAHVVSDPITLEKENKIVKIDEAKLKTYVKKAALIAWLKQYNPTVLDQVTEADIDQYVQASESFPGLYRDINVTSSSQNIYIYGPAFPDSINSPPVARIVDMGDSNSEVDVALLKLDAKQNLPVLKLSTNKPKVGDQVRIYGYPDSQFGFYADVFYKMDIKGAKAASKDLWNSILTATLTSGTVSAERPTQKGVIYFQTDATLDKGSSGSPVTDPNGNVIGMATMGIEGKNYNFFISSDYIIQMAKKNQVPLDEGFKLF